jgi:predicted oxidoreductase
LALDTAIDCGLTFFDLADIYKSGKSEIVFGHYLKENPHIREKIIIQSKVGIQLTGVPFGSRFNYSYSHIIESVEAILHAQRSQPTVLESSGKRTLFRADSG